MRDKVMMTTLLEGAHASERKYYFTRAENGKVYYCCALTPTEASCKYTLAQDKINDIVIIGSEEVVKSDDEAEPVALSNCRSLFESDPKSLSSYDLLRCRLAEYMDEKNGEEFVSGSLSDEEKEKVSSFLNSFFDGYIKDDSEKRPDRYFHMLAQEKDLQKALYEELREMAHEDFDRYKPWALSYLYEKLKDTFKMEPREDNTDIQIMLATLKEDESVEFPKQVMDAMDDNNDPDNTEGTDIYLCIQDTEASMILDIFNFVNMTRVFPGDEVKVVKTISTNSQRDVMANEILDVTKIQSMSELFSGVEAFLKYGKTKILTNYWKRSKIDNPLIDKIMCAMRNIDIGISLCDISDIERGIKSLRDIIRSGEVTIDGNSPIEMAMVILLDGIRRDYGRLLETDELEFIELVKWAYKKEFWQQSLTLIESRAPGDFVEKDFYFYCDSEENKDKVLNIFGHIYNEFKPYERYKLEDVNHYYIKFYNRIKTSRFKRGKDRMRDYAHIRVEELDSEDSHEIRACSACSDKSALEDLLTAYYYVGDTRNSTNHAIDTSDDSERMETIRECVEQFLQTYDKVEQLTDSSKANVVTITYGEVVKYANEMFRNERRSGGGHNGYDKKDRS